MTSSILDPTPRNRRLRSQRISIHIEGTEARCRTKYRRFDKVEHISQGNSQSRKLTSHRSQVPCHASATAPERLRIACDGRVQGCPRRSVQKFHGLPHTDGATTGTGETTWGILYKIQEQLDSEGGLTGRMVPPNPLHELLACRQRWYAPAELHDNLLILYCNCYLYSLRPCLNAILMMSTCRTLLTACLASAPGNRFRCRNNVYTTHRPHDWNTCIGPVLKLLVDP